MSGRISSAGVSEPAEQTRESVERFDPEQLAGLIDAEHRARYQWAAQAVRGKSVLDAGCGVGYGCVMLERAGAAQVVGVDLSNEAVAEARSRSAAVEFLQADIRALPFDDQAFDVVTCFEAIEHVTSPDAALDEFSRVLRPGGLLMLSSPNRDVYTPGNPHHVFEYKPAELEAALARRFTNVGLFRQHPWLTTLITDDEGFATADIASELQVDLRKTVGARGGEELYTVAAASDAPLPHFNRVALLCDVVDLRAWQERVSALEQTIEALAPKPWVARSRRVMRLPGRALRKVARKLR